MVTVEVSLVVIVVLCVVIFGLSLGVSYLVGYKSGVGAELNSVVEFLRQNNKEGDETNWMSGEEWAWQFENDQHRKRRDARG